MVLNCLGALYALIHSLTRLQRYLHHRHPEFSKQPVDSFCAKRDALSQIRLDKKGKYHQETAKAVKASYEIAMLIAKNKKPHTLKEIIVKPYTANAVKILLGDGMAKPPTAHMPPLTVGSCTPSIKGRSVCPILIIGNKQLHNIETTAIGPQVPFGNIESCGVMTPCVLDCRKCSRELRKPCGKWLCGPGLEICSRGNHC
ncbi:hypothetical protein Tsp_11291 [Trichinella spiralis]|uniref:hypothetical protein n=1 Tax=Trichinella spiralis TaxID=6334 RepID=UPI0001EFED35|nr:hypothetical protein Tsp_11291 [Trichinella spiralis]